MLHKEFFRFLIVGGVNTVVTLSLFEGLRRVAPYLLAYSVAYVTGIGVSYVLNTSFVFRRRKTVKTAALFPLVYVAQYLLGMLLMWLLVDHAGFGPTASVVIVTVISVPLTFVLSRTVLSLPRDSVK